MLGTSGTPAADQTLDRALEAATELETLLDARQAFRRTLAGWAGDLLEQRAGLSFCDAGSGDPEEIEPRHGHEQLLADYQDRDWKRLYQGSVLDD